MTNWKLLFFLLLCFWFLARGDALAQPNPGDVFREYIFTNTYGDAGGAIRVGGKKGVSYPDRGSDFDYVNEWVTFPHALDLQDVTRAEVVVEKVLSHNGTHGLAIQWNESDWIELPEPEAIPEPRDDYYHHTCITASVDPADLIVVKKSSTDATTANRFRLRVSPEHNWNWPQHLIYGVHLRVYYDPAKKNHVSARICTPVAESVIGSDVPLAVEISNRFRHVERVEYVGKYEGVNWEGDGVYYRWHYFYYHGRMTHHLGTATVYPYRCLWDASWVPDQREPISIAARVVDDTGLIQMTEAVSGLRLDRTEFSVELCRPEQTPSNWVTRRRSLPQKVTLQGDPANATAARLVWSSWSPGYMNGLTVNGITVLQDEGPHYGYYDHHVDLGDPSILKHGENEIRTEKTPLHHGEMVHGMEVNWPGIQLLVRYSKK